MISITKVTFHGVEDLQTPERLLTNVQEPSVQKIKIFMNLINFWKNNSTGYVRVHRLVLYKSREEPTGSLVCEFNVDRNPIHALLESAARLEYRFWPPIQCQNQTTVHFRLFFCSTPAD